MSSSRRPDADVAGDDWWRLVLESWPAWPCWLGGWVRVPAKARLQRSRDSPSASPLRRSPGDKPYADACSVNGLTLRIFASPSGLPLAKADTEWQLVNSRGAIESSGSGTVGPSLLAPPGVVNLGGGSSEGADGFQAIRNYQVTLAAITTVRVVDGAKVLDTMSPVTFDGVRFVVLAVLNVPSLQALVLQGLDASGAVVS